MLKIFSCLVLLFISVFAFSDANSHLSRCQLATQLYKNYGIPKSQLADWVCLANAESSLNTAAISSTEGNGSKNYGIFQINSYYWCSGGFRSTYNQCNVRCSALTNYDISDDVRCAKLIYSRQGFNAWNGWKNNCRGKNLSNYIFGCNL